MIGILDFAGSNYFYLLNAQRALNENGIGLSESRVALRVHAIAKIEGIGGAAQKYKAELRARSAVRLSISSTYLCRRCRRMRGNSCSVRHRALLAR